VSNISVGAAHPGRIFCIADITASFYLDFISASCRTGLSKRIDVLRKRAKRKQKEGDKEEEAKV